MLTTATAMRTETLLSVRGINLSFGEKVVLRNICAEIKNLIREGQTAGQIVAVLGPSGIGKSQLLRILAGLQQPSSGSVLVGSKQEPVKAGMVGMVSQRYHLYHNRTVLGNLMVAAMQKVNWREWLNPRVRAGRRFTCLDTMGRFGLADKRNRYPAELSGGQQQRVAIAQQLLCSEHFILLDEPTTGLDPASKRNVCQMLVEVANADDLNTIIMVTHDIPSALAVADTIWLMGRESDEHGEIIPGARIMDTYDLIELGLMWQEDVYKMPEFTVLLQEIQDRFIGL